MFGAIGGQGFQGVGLSVILVKVEERGDELGLLRIMIIRGWGNVL